MINHIVYITILTSQRISDKYQIIVLFFPSLLIENWYLGSIYQIKLPNTSSTNYAHGMDLS